MCAPPSTDLQTNEAALADLQHGALQTGNGKVEVLAAERLAIELDAALGDQPAALGAGDPEGIAQDGGHVDGVSVGRDAVPGNLVGEVAIDVQAIEVRLGL